MHSILFDNAPNDWNEALPLGNGTFGAMAFYKEGAYQLALNHYEVYYQRHHQYSHLYQKEEAENEQCGSLEEYAAMEQRASSQSGDCEAEGYFNYRKTIWPQADVPTQVPLTAGASHPSTGELAFGFAPELEQPEDYRLFLEIENAAVVLEIKNKTSQLRAETRVLTDSDILITRLEQSTPDLVRSVTLSYPQRRGHEGFSWEYTALDDNTFVCRVSFYPEGEDRQKYPPFSFVTLHRLLGAKGLLQVEGQQANIALREQTGEVTLLSCVVTELFGENDLAETALLCTNRAVDLLADYLEAHRQKWAAFFSRSCVTLPDPVLERLWYLNLYVLECSSGRDGKRKEQASGLNGLWDIRQPTLWGSLWYWDVNIEASYWPVYTANHLELAKVFCEGFLTYQQAGEKRAQDCYGVEGYAIDYPHPYYNSTGPWCAQFLWWYYEYSGDITFLREKAYPMFRQQIRFIDENFNRDPETGYLVFFPDVSPEQGPITKNSTITLAVVKYLLRVALEANRLLDESPEDAALFSSLLKIIPPYATAKLDRYGKLLKDSELAPAGISLRHPSVLMPIYPLWELGPYGSKQDLELAENTVRFASEHTELGVFSFGWISAAAARLGKGNMALRVLYEQGLDLILRANGMGAEETDRWMNHCVIRRTSLYHPFMMECVGEIVACVNEMLLQSQDGVIRVFPAVPDGTAEAWRNGGREKPLQEKPAPNWEDCAFEGLLAKGGVEVSAAMQKGKICWISLKSIGGGKVRLQLPLDLAKEPLLGADGRCVSAEMVEGVLNFEMEAGAVYQMGSQPRHMQKEEQTVLDFTTHLGRKAFVGKNRNTDTFKLLESFLYDYYVGNNRYQPVIAYRFNFGRPLDEIAALSSGDSLVGMPSPTDLTFLKITPEQQYTSYYGFGFGCGESLAAVDTQQTSYLLRDYIHGDEPTSFEVELPKGRYDFLVVSGGVNSVTHITAGQEKIELTGEEVTYTAGVLPVVHHKDGVVTLHIDTLKGNSWNLNLLVIRKIAAYL